MVENSKSRSTSLKKLAKWTPSTTQVKKSNATPLNADAPFSPIHYDQLQQGSLYITKVKQVSLALFEGWNDDMCCFSILRSEVEPMRWSETRQLPGDFDIYHAFDEYGNPPIHLWSRYLKTSLPANWFYMFEEARRKQCEWFKKQEEYQHDSTIENNQEPSFSNTDVSSMLLSSQTSNLSSAIASTNIIDPSASNIDMSTPASTYDNTESPSEAKQVISPRSTSLVIDREQIRRHLAPGQATAFNRQSFTTKNTSPLPGLDMTTNENRSTIEQYSAQLDFPHDSDQFSIHSDIPSPMPTKTRSRPSIKNRIWG